MTVRTSYGVECICGHRGYIHKAEDDQSPGKPYEHYWLEDLRGTGFNLDGASKGWDEVFAKLKLRCPECDSELTPKNLSK